MDVSLSRRALLLGAAVAIAPALPARAAAARRPFTARVFATREGMVGETTATGHVIVKNDLFVALPSRSALKEEVTVRYKGRSATVPVLDVGPWNIDDDWWNTADVRERWGELPRGVPQSQAAYLWGFNNGKDGKGRRVKNPAGIDLADGVFRGVLGMSGNDWVDVTFPFVTALSTGNGPTCPQGTRRCPQFPQDRPQGYPQVHRWTCPSTVVSHVPSPCGYAELRGGSAYEGTPRTSPVDASSSRWA